jgi:hypothetical protein
MKKRFNHSGALKGMALCLAALFCAGGLAAQDIQVAVLEPSGGKDVKAHFSLARNAFIETISQTGGFAVMDRSKTDQILKEHHIQRTSGLIAESEARELGKMLGVDVIFSSDVTAHADSLEVSCQALDIVTGRIVASKSEIIEAPTSKLIRDACQDMAGEMLKIVNRNMSGGINRDQAGGGQAGGTGRGQAGGNPRLVGLDAEIQRMVMNNKTNAKWNRNKDNYSLEVDMAGVQVSENRQFGTPVYSVGGAISIMLTDMASGDTVGADVELEKFTEMSDERIRNKITAQVRPKLTEIIRELLSGLEE